MELITPNFPTEAIHQPDKEMGLGYSPLRDKVTQTGKENLMEVLNKPTDRGFLAYAHTSRVATTYQHWPKEAFKVNHAKLSTSRVISYIQHIPGAELDHIPNLHAPNHIATSTRTTAEEVDENIANRREHIPTSLHPNNYARHLRNQY